MYVEPSTAGDLWPWALTPLTARAVSAFLIGFAAAAAYAAWDNRLGRFAGAAYSYAVLGALELLAAAVFSGDLDGGYRTVLYVAFTVTVLAVGVAGSLAVRRVQRS
jgi:peptidoglycan/LPS O-acetylase OafA/YrhL